MSHDRTGGAGSSADLAALRESLRRLSGPESSETALREAFRARRAARSLPGLQSGWQALAAGVGLMAVGTLVGLLVNSGLDGLRTAHRSAAGAGTAVAVPRAAPGSFDATLDERTERLAAESQGIAEDAAGEETFAPLPYAPRISPSESYSIVRARIPLSSLALHAGGVDGTVEVDLLIGQDGLARGIHFGSPATLLVQAASE